MTTSTLTFEALRAANIARLPTFKNSVGEPAHSEPDGSDWALSAWCNAALGELGEVAEVIDTIERSGEVVGDVRADFAKELADVVTYVDILASRLSVEFAPLTFMVLRLESEHRWAARPSVALASRSNLVLLRLGQAAGLIKKIERGDFSVTDVRDRLVQALSRCLVQLDMLALSINVDLGSAVVAKFNEVSRRVGSPVFLHPTLGAVAAEMAEA